MKNRLNIGKIYFIYLFLILFLQIVGVSNKGGIIDTLWKASVISATLFYVLVKTNMKIKRYVVIPLFIYVLGQVIAILSNPHSSTTSFINCMIIVAMTYMFLSMPYYNLKYKLTDMIWFVNAFIILMLYAVGFNLVKNPSAVLGAFSNTNVYSNMMSSFFDNKQTFGMFLFMAFIVSIWGFVLKNQKRYIGAAIIFFVNLFLCLSRTALFACLGFVFIIMVSIRKSNRRLFGILIFLIILVVLLIQFNPTLHQFIENVVLDTNATMEARTNIWEDAFKAIHNIKFIWGYGEGNATAAIATVSHSANAHNGIVYVLLTGGIVKLSLYSMVVLKALFSIREIRKYNSTVASMFFAALISVIIYSMGEALVLLDSSAPCVVASIICVAFPIATEGYYALCRTSVEHRS